MLMRRRQTRILIMYIVTGTYYQTSSWREYSNISQFRNDLMHHRLSS
ncbi:hypothetical protein Hamer_G000804 [Homarus americanus]|uniref:Uncharacterized protein n=1 Tax=Homarus americanus TaxID=6706 RepID=A0A8J5N2D4_HOMAM|nr:hypothetical protein Hamer_G000804 [Homarus americanus]